MKRFVNICGYCLKKLKNMYVLSFACFFIYIMFFDRHDLISQYKMRQELQHLKEDREYYFAENEKNRQAMHELMTNPENLEKFAREQYLMKRENEDIFVIVDE